MDFDRRLPIPPRHQQGKYIYHSPLDRMDSSGRSTGKIPINFLLASEDTNTVRRQQQQQQPESSSRPAYPSSSSSQHWTNPTSPQTLPTSPTRQQQQWHHDPNNTTTLLLDNRKPRAPRPSYSEEQKFFIMYSRIIRDHTWPQIEDQFERLFGTRSKGGLTSVYYRVRREWGLMEVLKSGPGSVAADCREVEQRAMNFSREFLSQIGYLSNSSSG